MLLAPETAELEHAPAAHSPAASRVTDLRTTLRQYILQNFLFTEDPTVLDDNESLMQRGIIDSVGALEIALFIEQTFGFSVKEDEMLPENLDSVTQLTRFVESRWQGA